MFGHQAQRWRPCRHNLCLGQCGRGCCNGHRHHYHRRRAVAWAETQGGAGSGGPPGCLCLWQASSLLGRGSHAARDKRDLFVKSDPSESVGRRPRYFVSGGHTWSPNQLSATGKTAMSVTRLVLKRGSAAVTASTISDEKLLSMWPFHILL